MYEERGSTWLAFFVILAFALLVAMAAGCASNRYTAAVQVVEKDVAFKVEVSGHE